MTNLIGRSRAGRGLTRRVLVSGSFRDGQWTRRDGRMAGSNRDDTREPVTYGDERISARRGW